LAGIDPRVLDIRLLRQLIWPSAKWLDSTTSNRTDIETLARRGLISAPAFRQRAEEAVGGYIGDLTRLRGSIEQAARLIADLERRQQPARPPSKSRS